MKLIGLLITGLLFACSSAHAQDDPVQKLKELEAEIAKTPENPMLLYRKAHNLMKIGKLEEGHQAAKEAMSLFIKEGNNLSWMKLEQIDLDDIRVDVHFNMGPKERTPPDRGIIRPLSFRVWAKGEKARLIEIIDFEISLSDGKPATAALGQMMGNTHANFGIMDTNSTYTKIRERLIKLVKARHKKNPDKAPEAKARESKLRNWSTKDGKFTTEAELVSFADGKATLKKTNGKTIVIDVEKLSDADRTFLGQPR